MHIFFLSDKKFILLKCAHKFFMRIFRIYVQLGVSIQHFFFMRYSKKRIKIYQISRKQKQHQSKQNKTWKRLSIMNDSMFRSRQKCLSTITHRCLQSFEGCLKDLTFISPQRTGSQWSLSGSGGGRHDEFQFLSSANGRTCSTCWETIPIKHTQLQDSSRSHYYCVHSLVRLA